MLRLGLLSYALTLQEKGCSMTIYKKKFHGTNFCETLQKNAKGALHKCFGKSNLNVNYIRPVRPVRHV